MLPTARSRRLSRHAPAALLLIAITLCTVLVSAQSQSNAATEPAAAATAHWQLADVGIERGSVADEGEKMRGQLTQWDESVTFTFPDNATLRIRVDPLNSTMQPYLIRQFGQSSEAQAVHRFTEQALQHAQDYAWPLRPFLWAWSDLRAYVRGDEVNKLRFSFKRTPGALCLGLQYVAEASKQLNDYVSPAVVSAVQTVLHGCAWALCEQCWNGCPLECTPVGSSNSLCYIKLSPYHAPSVTVTAPAKPYLAMATPDISFDFSFKTYLSWMYVQYFFFGLVLFHTAHRLSRSRSFHYFLGAAIGITFSVVLALYFVSRQTKSASRMIPGMQLLQSVGTAVSYFAPVTAYVVLPQIYKFLGWAAGHLIAFWNADEVLGIPYLGKIYFLSFGVIGCLLVWWNQWGASPKSEEHQDEAEIEEIGYLDEELPLTTAQAALARLLQLMGLMMLFESTSSTESSLLIVLLALLTGLFEFLGTTAYFWYHYEAPGRHTKLISTKEYEKQAQTETERALQKLQQYLKENPDELDRVKEENEVRVRRFAKGRNHLDTSQPAGVHLARPARSSWSCVVQ